jgi:hypothetical protein
MIPKSGYRFSEKIMLRQKSVRCRLIQHAAPRLGPGVENPADREAARGGEYQFDVPVVATRTGSGR